MASLLQCTKFYRHFTHFGTYNSTILLSNRTAEVFLTPKIGLSECYSTFKENTSLEPLLDEINFEVKTIGRITKKNIDKMLLQIQVVNNVTSLQSLQAIRCCGGILSEETPQSRTSLIKEVWSLLIKKRYAMDVMHYNALLQVYIENEYSFLPEEFLKNMRSNGIQPNRLTFERIAWRYCQKGAVEKASEVLETIRDHNMPLSESLYNALIMGYTVRGDMASANGILDIMSLAGINASHRTYCLLACGYAKKGAIDDIVNVLSTAMNKDVLITDKDLLDIIEHLTLGGHADKVSRIIPYLHKERGQYGEIYICILKLLNNGSEPVARMIWKTMIPDNISGQQWQFKTAYIKKNIESNIPVSKVIELLKELRDEDLISNAFNIASESAVSMGNKELTLKLFDELQKEGNEIRQHYYWPLLAQRVLDKDEDGLLEIVGSMCIKNLLPTYETCREYLFPFLLNKYSPQRVVDKLMHSKLLTFNLIIYLLEKKGKHETINTELTSDQRNKSLVSDDDVTTVRNKASDIKTLSELLNFLTSIPQKNQEIVDRHDNDVIVMTGVANNPVNIDDLNVAKQLLSLALTNEIKIDTDSAEEIRKVLNSRNLNIDTSEFLEKITLSHLKSHTSCTTSEMQRSTERHMNKPVIDENSIEEVYALVMGNQYDEAMKLLKSYNSNKAKSNNKIDIIFWRILNTLAERREVDKVKEMTKTLLDCSYVKPSTVILGASIKVHYFNDDIDGALKEYERCCLQYKIAPWSAKLMKTLISYEDTDKLKHLIDLTSQVTDEERTYADLFCIYIECGRPNEAGQILKNPKLLNTIRTRLETICRRYAELGKMENLEVILETTKMAARIDRPNIFYHLLVTYCKANETDKAVNLWIRMQEENEVPNDEFLLLLGNHLKRNNREVPFNIPSKKKEGYKKVDKYASPIEGKHVGHKNTRQNLDNFLNAVKISKTYKDVKDASNKLRKGITLGEVVQDKEMLSKYQEIVQIAASYDYKLPAINLWQQLLLAGMNSEANIIFQSYLYHSHSVILGPAVKRLLALSQQRKKPEIVKNLIDVLQGMPKIVRETLGFAYSTLINMYIDDGNVGEAKACLKQAYKNGITKDYLDTYSIE